MFGRMLANAIMVLAVLACGSSGALAQEESAIQSLTGRSLALDTVHGDWAVRCFDVRSIAPCDILQIANNQDTNQRVLLVSIAYIPSGDSYAAQIIVPLGVALGRGMTLAAGASTLDSVKFTRCERDGCYVEMPITAATISGLSGLTGNTTISVMAYGQGTPISLPLSLNGFGDALAEMVGEARQRAVDPPAP